MHRKSWLDFEKVLHVRSTMCLIVWLFWASSALFSFSSAYGTFLQRSLDYAEEDQVKVNVEAATYAIAILAWTFPIWAVLGWLLLIVSYWKPSLSKTYPIYYTLFLL